MAYCNWCQLESESDDFCVWCKRPLGTAKGVHQQARSDLHFLRSSDDDGHYEATPIFAIIGAVVLLGLVAGGLLAFHAKKDEVAESDHWVLKDQAPDPSAQAQPTTQASYAAAPPVLFVPRRPEAPEPQKSSSSRRPGIMMKDDYALAMRSNGAG